MVDLDRQVRVTQARQGGFSAHILPTAVKYERFNTFIFAPQLIGAQWQLTDGTPISYWTASELGAAAPLSTFRAAGGPSGRDAVRHFPYLWGGFQTEQDPRFSPSPSASGITLDGWVYFAPTSAANDGGFTVEWGLSREQTTSYLFNLSGSSSTPAPSISLRLEWLTEPSNTPPGGRIFLSMIYSANTGGTSGGSGAQIVLSAANSQSTSGWHHYAAEYSSNGGYVLYFDGQPVKNGTTVAPDLSQMRVMHGSWVFVQQNQTVVPPDYADMSYLRCRYQLPYGGQPFTP